MLCSWLLDYVCGFILKAIFKINYAAVLNNLHIQIQFIVWCKQYTVMLTFKMAKPFGTENVFLYINCIYIYI